MTCLRLCFSICLLFTTTFGYSQSLQRQDTIKMICREWKFKDGHSENLDDNSQELKDFIKNTRILFKGDMTYVEKYDTSGQYGKWTYDSLKKEIMMEDGEGNKVIMKIISLSSSMLKFESKALETNMSASGTLIPSG